MSGEGNDWKVNPNKFTGNNLSEIVGNVASGRQESPLEEQSPAAAQSPGGTSGAEKPGIERGIVHGANAMKAAGELDRARQALEDGVDAEVQELAATFNRALAMLLKNGAYRYDRATDTVVPALNTDVTDRLKKKEDALRACADAAAPLPSVRNQIIGTADQKFGEIADIVEQSKDLRDRGEN